jgi:dUTP pyrophosphatase
VLNSPGTIDSDYRGEIKVLLINLGQEVIYLERGHRIAQLVVAAIAQVTWQETDTLPPSERPESGYGSTGR